MVGAKRAARFTSRVSDECSTDELHSRDGVPSRNLTDNLTHRTRPLCALSYGDELVGVPGNAPGLGTHLVRFRL
jgi:hypothetical protein